MDKERFIPRPKAATNRRVSDAMKDKEHFTTNHNQQKGL